MEPEDSETAPSPCTCSSLSFNKPNIKLRNGLFRGEKKNANAVFEYDCLTYYLVNVILDYS